MAISKDLLCFADKFRCIQSCDILHMQNIACLYNHWRLTVNVSNNFFLISDFWPFCPQRGQGLSLLTSPGSAGGHWSSFWGLPGLGLLTYRCRDSCHDNMRYAQLLGLIVFFFLGQLYMYLGDGSSHCYTYAIRWLCLVNCVMWWVCAAGCAREWVVLMTFGYRELISIELSVWLMREKYYMSYPLVT